MGRARVVYGSVRDESDGFRCDSARVRGELCPPLPLDPPLHTGNAGAKNAAKMIGISIPLDSSEG